MDYLWEVKNVVNKVKHVVLNLTEMESKVMDATNGDKWGASSTDMQNIAKGTFHFQQFNEIMGILVKRLSERDPAKWRSVYKALTLLEYLIKNGSEKVIDFGRSHLALLKSLKSYHCIDEKNKDQGINVKNRSKEIVELLNSTERIQQERKIAKSNKSKYVGIASDQAKYSSGFGSSSSSVAPYNFNQPDAYTKKEHTTSPTTNYNFESYQKETKVKETPLPPPPTDLLDLDDPIPSTSTKGDDGWGDFETVSQSVAGGDDDFGDFQSVTSTSTSTQPTFSAPPNQKQPTQLKSNDSIDILGGLDSISFNSTAQPLTTNLGNFAVPAPAPVPVQSTLNKPATSQPKTELWDDFDKLVNLDDLKKPANTNKPEVKTMNQIQMDRPFGNNLTNNGPNFNQNFNSNSALNNTTNQFNMQPGTFSQTNKPKADPFDGLDSLI